MDTEVSGVIRTLREPVSKRELTTREKILVLEGSRLQGSIFPPWSTSPAPSEFFDATIYQDETYFHLSRDQSEVMCGWRRLHNIIQQVSTLTDEPGNARPIGTGILDLVQDITTDCSVVASLCAIVSRTTEGGFPSLFTGIFHPWDQARQVAGMSISGKYIFRFYFNGSYRKVVIDDRLPTTETERKLYVVDRNNATVLWPALIEKAYLKVRGGYDFPGSNSGTDLWVLTGWIPEQLFLQSIDLDSFALWQRLFQAFKYGDVLITLGTGKLSEKEERGLGLIGEHDYAVIKMREHRGQKVFLVKNPWSKGTAWKGHVHYTDEVPRQLEDLGIESDPKPIFLAQESLGPGMFWISLDHLFQNFESMYLNWNPGLFSHREDIHVTWDLTKYSSPEGCFRSNPQYSAYSGRGGVVWLLLSKHLTSQKTSSSKPRSNDRRSDVEEGFISLYCFTGGCKVFSSRESISKSEYVDSPNTLLKIDMPCNTMYTVAISQQSLSPIPHTFTLSALSSVPVKLSPAQDPYIHVSTHHGRWTSLTAGGNAGSSLYYLNPQYCMKLLEKSNVSLILESPSKLLPVHIKVVWAGGKTVRTVTTRDIVGDSGEYTNGFALAEVKDVSAGTYTIVCSTFEQGQLGAFCLHICCTTKPGITRIPVSGAGRFTADMKKTSFPPGVDRLTLPLVTRRMNRVSVTVHSTGDRQSSARTARSPLKVSIELGRGALAQVLAISGEDDFVDTNAGGAYIQDVSIEPQMCANKGILLALERLATSGLTHVEEVTMDIRSDEPLEWGQWISHHGRYN